MAALLTCSASIANAELSGAADVSLLNSSRTNTDTDIEGSPFKGFALSGFVSNTLENNLRVTADVRWEELNEDNSDIYVTGPKHAGVFGLHGGKVFGDIYTGLFIGAGFADGDDDGIKADLIYGIEADLAVNSTVNVFGQLGYVSEAIDDADDNEFDGYAVRFGASKQFTDQLSASIDYERAKSSTCFEDCGNDWGEYRSFGIDVTYVINDDLHLIAGYENQKITANTEDDGSAKNFTIGIRVPFGGSNGRNNLATPIGGFHAAGWMSPLD